MDIKDRKINVLQRKVNKAFVLHNMIPSYFHSVFFFNETYILWSYLLQIENLEELLKEKDNQVDIARTKLSAVQAQTFSSEGTVTSLEEALADRDKQINQLREQRDRAEKDVKEEKV